MKIAIVSTVYGSPWAGSEELWYQTGLKCLALGHQVSASVFKVFSPCTQHENFITNGGELFYRPRIGNGKLYLLKHKYLSAFNNIFLKEPDILILSVGSMTDLVMYPDLIRYLNKNKHVKVVIICLYNSDTIIPDAFTRNIIRFFCERANGITFVSEHNYLLTERQIACKLKNVHVFSSPVSYLKTEDALLEWPENNGALQMASVARLDVATKGQDVLLETLSSPKWKQRDWHLNLYGKGEDYEYIQQLIAFYELTDKVSFGGFVNDTRDIWKLNHLLVMPSRSEGLSLAFLEAMLCGRICVVTDVGGFGEVLVDMESGFIAEAPIAKYFDAALERAWQSQAQFDVIRKNANHAASKIFKYKPVDKMVQILVDIHSK